MISHETYMLRCLQLAKKGIRNVYPNPMVGCVIVYKNTIIGEGYHKNYGEAHAEVNAINSVKNKSLLAESTIYISLEPCAHFGKTPPCADLIVQHKIPHVVIGCIDTYAEVAGKGIEKLKKAGIKITLGVLEKECLAINKRFFTFHNKKRPYIILKWAQTQDGFIDIDRQKNFLHDNWITCAASKKLVHKWRSEEHAIMIGTNTALNDNPSLTVREWKGKNPIRVVLDLNLRLPKNLTIFNDEAPIIVFNSLKNEVAKNITYIKIESTENILQQCMYKLYEQQITSIFIEGGAQLLQSFINENLWDEAKVFTGNKTFEKGLKAPIITSTPISTEMIGEDELLLFKN
ncbi:MAG: bifunctional diaminohydroxyphosphoribosylaminopyrimidine deaminase/5-amino-6-(5-phosphoribosylamino)uracil reductase RibD [Flavobacteriales bacterium]|nr:bifunctional diaminohydroxyphosphoribosylaminopyrimidine deaminase/5-amino-6-(5-phosphoribosylamino)uracil reductase RibD [Flavobacteriales bacterium]MCW8912979.1 bifunctional diaminohydroxyphosphoribosylaminopyrimidine deaminase/5-amino-6-(5-phosphoribosylamino)uracil reductase RibD [Flavobacteriales bacterium]MCW8938987.1 bifunctional diaminohydroxyphosphoribosylaminopyrimidine deaminase/5-amino-6-(5-phosphoribosylamino)uracil reductase RibD [Flavobacteriales bacterium]MCW8940244.1 bifuncti